MSFKRNVEAKGIVSGFSGKALPTLYINTGIDFTVSEPNVATKGEIYIHTGVDGNTFSTAQPVLSNRLYRSNGVRRVELSEYNVEGTIVTESSTGISYRKGALASDTWDLIQVSVTSTPIDASVSVYSDTLPAATGSGSVRFYINQDVTNLATLNVSSGESLNESVDGIFYFSNYAVGTQFVVTDYATGKWTIAVEGESTPVDSLSEVFDPSVELSISGATPSYADVFLTSASGNIVIDNTGRCSITRIGGDKALITITVSHDDDDVTTFTLSNTICPGKIVGFSSHLPTNNSSSNYRVNITGEKTFQIDRPAAIDATYTFSFVLVVDGFEELNKYILAGMVSPTSLHKARIYATSTQTIDAVAVSQASEDFDWIAIGLKP